jgi:glutathione S-transferase
MALALYGHPFSSYTQKVLISLYENKTPFEFREIGPDHPENIQEWMERWPLAKFPMLLDGDRQVVETSIIIEYLQVNHPGPVRLIPDDAQAALDVRFLDRVFDLHIMNVQQMVIEAKLERMKLKTEDALAYVGPKLDAAYAWLDQLLSDGRTWAAGEAYTLADAAASPSLFYADWTYEIPAALSHLKAYRARLLKRPSFARAVDEARYFRKYFPLGAPDRD